MRFNVGDRVRCINGYDGNNDIVDKCGVIIALEENEVCVEFDESINGHNGNTTGHTTPTGRHGHCWWVCETLLEYEADNKFRYVKLEYRFV